MIASNIHQLCLTIQGSKERSFTVTTIGKALKSLLQDLIHEYGTYQYGTIYINSDSFTIAEKKLLLSYIIDADEYEYANQSMTTLEAVFNEYKHWLDAMLDDECGEVYRSIMEEHGQVAYRHRDNGETVWRTR